MSVLLTKAIGHRWPVAFLLRSYLVGLLGKVFSGEALVK